MENQEKLCLIKEIWDCIGEAIELDSDSSDKEDILLGLANFGEEAALLPVKRARRQWVKEWRKQKAERGSFAFLSKELLVHDENSYKNYLRLSKAHFDFLLGLIKDDIQRSDTVMRSAIPEEEKLAMTLRFLGTGESYISLDYQTRLSKSTICGFVSEVCNALYRRLKSSYLKVFIIFAKSIRLEGHSKRICNKMAISQLSRRIGWETYKFSSPTQRWRILLQL